MNKYKYLLHGHFNDDISKTISKTRKLIYNKFKNNFSNEPFNYGYPHITIIYGPVFHISKNKDKGNLIVKQFDKNVIDKFYPNFLNKFNKLPSDIKFIGVTPFFSLDRVIIKAEFESKELNKIRNFLINCNPDIKKYYDEFKSNKKNNEKEIKKMFPNIYIKDKTYNKIPKGWIHATLAVLKSDIGENKILEIIKHCNDILYKYNIQKDNIFCLKEIGLNLNNTFIKIELY